MTLPRLAYVLALIFVFVSAAARAQQNGIVQVPGGCRLETFSISLPAEWNAANIQNPPEGREGCIFMRLRDDKSPAAIIEVESLAATLPLVQTADPFATLVEKITGGMKSNMNVVVGQVTFRNDDLKRAPGTSIDKAMMVVFDATVIGDSRRHEVAIAVARSPRFFFTVFAVTPAARADAALQQATRAAFRQLLNSLRPIEK